MLLDRFASLLLLVLLPVAFCCTLADAIECLSINTLPAAGGIPTGLFIHVDPEPVLTTLCIV